MRVCPADKALQKGGKVGFTGKCYAYLPKLGSNELQVFSLTGHRWKLTEQGKASRTIYIPNTDLYDVEHHGRNYAISIKYKGKPGFYFGVFLSANFQDAGMSTITFLECKCNAIEHGGRVIYPFSNLPANATFDQVTEYFTLKTVLYSSLDNNHSKFLNMLTGKPCNPLVIGNVIAHEDGCLQMDPKGPDKVFTRSIRRQECEPANIDFAKQHVPTTITATESTTAESLMIETTTTDSSMAKLMTAESSKNDLPTINTPMASTELLTGESTTIELPPTDSPVASAKRPRSPTPTTGESPKKQPKLLNQQQQQNTNRKNTKQFREGKKTAVSIRVGRKRRLLGSKLKSGKRTTEVELHAVPLLGKKNRGKFGLVDATGLKKLADKSGRRKVQCHNKMVVELAEQVIELKVIDTANSPGGVQIILEPCEAANVPYDVDDSNDVSVNICDCTGVKVVEWGQLSAAISQIDPMLFNLFRFTFGNIMFGGRKASAIVGQNGYFSRRLSGIAGPTPLQYSAKDHQYHRQHWKDFFVPACNVATNSLESMTIAASSAMDPKVTAFLQELAIGSRTQRKALGINAIKILTTGILKKWISFANTSHIDKNDKLLEVLKEKAEHLLSEMEKDTSNHLVYKYLLQMDAMFFNGISMPTHCAYAFAGAFPKSWKLYQYFLYDGLGVAVRFTKGWTQQFYGAEIAHNTAVTVAVDGNDMVHFHTNKAVVVAWGAGASYRE
ncbi:hypothetical protein MPSEU_000023300 [Mayamaea pseudoterrestris]|nr:hypothetical protein MPSEU_000023300 [Mayamaea pseudoterrestris]